MSDPHRDANRVNPAARTSTTLSTTASIDQGLHQHVLALILVPLCALVLVALISLLVTYLVRRSRRITTHSLLPVYHYIASDQDQGWESDLLDDCDPPFVRENQRPIVRASPPSSQPTLHVEDRTSNQS